MRMTVDYDLIVIGVGPAGEKAAAQAAYFSKRVVTIERAAEGDRLRRRAYPRQRRDPRHRAPADLAHDSWRGRDRLRVRVHVRRAWREGRAGRRARLPPHVSRPGDGGAARRIDAAHGHRPSPWPALDEREARREPRGDDVP